MGGWGMGEKRIIRMGSMERDNVKKHKNEVPAEHVEKNVLISSNTPAMKNKNYVSVEL